MKKHASLIVAEQVLLELQTYEVDTSNWYIEVMSNCREQCLTIDNWTNNRMAVFGRNKNSDDVIVYWGNKNNFHISTNQPDNWGHKRYFGTIRQAADFIVSYLQGE